VSGAGDGRVLLIEDNLDDVLLTRRALKKAGVDAPLAVCGDGDEGVSYLTRERAPALVLLDWKLPRRSGLEVLTWIRANRALAGLPVLVLSSSRMQEDIDGAYLAGADSFLEKPLSFTQLLDFMARMKLDTLRTTATTRAAGPEGSA
jgi:two-component system, response regulator